LCLFFSILFFFSIHSFNQLDLPEYENYEQLRQQLLVAINETLGFGFA